MFDFLPRLAVERPVLTTMLVAISLVLGVFGWSRMQTDLFPEVEFPFVSVITAYPGAGPEEIETQLTDRIEESVSGLAGIRTLSSWSQENVSIVFIEFELGVHPDQASIDVRDRVESVRGLLPPEVESPVVQKFDFGAMPIMNWHCRGRRARTRCSSWRMKSCASGSPALTAWPACRSWAAVHARSRYSCPRSGCRRTA
jgi:hydrophobic/amphiphilic exporter-1 (mainly G- bacteria), HAE1 family